jgi:hypothetical protein
MARIGQMIFLIISALLLTSCAHCFYHCRPIPTNKPVVVVPAAAPPVKVVAVAQAAPRPVLVRSNCWSGCCGRGNVPYPTCGRSYWVCTEYNLTSAKCSFWEFRYPRWPNGVVVY